MKIKFDVDALTFGDMADFEEATGLNLQETIEQMAKGSASAKALVAVVWICQRTVEPDFTLEQARRTRLSDVEFEVPEPDPTPGSG